MVLAWTLYEEVLNLGTTYNSGSHILEQHLLSISRMVCIDSSLHNIFTVHNTGAFIAADETGQTPSFTKGLKPSRFSLFLSDQANIWMWSTDNIQIENK